MSHIFITQTVACLFVDLLNRRACLGLHEMPLIVSSVMKNLLSLTSHLNPQY